MEKNPDVVLLVPKKMNYIEEKGKTFDEFTKWYIFPPVYRLVVGNDIGNVGNIFRRSFVKKHKIKYNPIYSCGEDFDFWLQILYNNGRVERIDTQEPLLGTRSYGALSIGSDCRIVLKKLREEVHQKVGCPYDENKWDTCKVVKKTIEKYPNVFSEKTIGEIIDQCPSDTDSYIKVSHREWGMDYLIFEEGSKRVFRKLNKEEATVLNFTQNEKITVKWDRWGEETFLFDENRGIYCFEKTE